MAMLTVHLLYGNVISACSSSLARPEGRPEGWAPGGSARSRPRRFFPPRVGCGLDAVPRPVSVMQSCGQCPGPGQGAGGAGVLSLELCSQGAGCRGDGGPAQAALRTQLGAQAP